MSNSSVKLPCLDYSLTAQLDEFLYRDGYDNRNSYIFTSRGDAVNTYHDIVSCPKQRITSSVLAKLKNYAAGAKYNCDPQAVGADLDSNSTFTPFEYTGFGLELLRTLEALYLLAYCCDSRDSTSILLAMLTIPIMLFLVPTFIALVLCTRKVINIVKFITNAKRDSLPSRLPEVVRNNYNEAKDHSLKAARIYRTYQIMSFVAALIGSICLLALLASIVVLLVYFNPAGIAGLVVSPMLLQGAIIGCCAGGGGLGVALIINLISKVYAYLKQRKYHYHVASAFYKIGIARKNLQDGATSGTSDNSNDEGSSDTSSDEEVSYINHGYRPLAYNPAYVGGIMPPPYTGRDLPPAYEDIDRC